MEYVKVQQVYFIELLIVFTVFHMYILSMLKKNSNTSFTTFYISGSTNRNLACLLEGVDDTRIEIRKNTTQQGEEDEDGGGGEDENDEDGGGDENDEDGGGGEAAGGKKKRSISDTTQLPPTGTTGRSSTAHDSTGTKEIKYGCPEGFKRVTEYICLHYREKPNGHGVPSTFKDSQNYCRVFRM